MSERLRHTGRQVIHNQKFRILVMVSVEQLESTESRRPGPSRTVARALTRQPPAGPLATVACRGRGLDVGQ